jgi:hypothetical protein
MSRAKNLPKKIRHILCACQLQGKHYTHAIEEVSQYCSETGLPIPEIKETYYKRIRGYIKHWLQHPLGPEQAIFEHAYVKTRSYKETKEWIDALNKSTDNHRM